MRKTILLWVLAFFITVASAHYQRMTGPTYPLKGKAQVNGQSLEYELDRSHGGEDDHPVGIQVPDNSYEGDLYYRRLNTNDVWQIKSMHYDGDRLIAKLPHQPPAGKLQYKVKLYHNDKSVVLPSDDGVVIRFKGKVPNWALIPHIIFMFLGMMVSTRAGLQAIWDGSKLLKYSLWSLALLFLGGLVFGPIVQNYAFGDYWTGVPFGIDLTDNKTLIAFIFWLIALIMVWKNKVPRIAVVTASILMFITFMIPHSMLGSELDYKTGEIKQAHFECHEVIMFNDC